MISTFLVDDEPIAIKHLAALIGKHCPQLEIVGTASSVEEAALQIAALKPGLVLLDIELAGQNSFDLLERFQHRPYEVIFVTAHDNFGIRALKQGAADYLLKPVNKTELALAAEKVAEKIYKKRTAAAISEKNEAACPARLALPAADGLLLIDTSRIMYCESEGRYTRFYTNGNKKILVTRNLGAYEALLLPPLFIRIHHHCIINLSYVERYVNGRGGYVIMQNGTTLPVSSRRKDDFLGCMQQ